MELMDELASWWSGLESETRAALIGATATFVAATIGVLAVIWQIARQARHAIEQNRQNETLKLKLQIYEEISETCQREVRAETEFSSLVREFDWDVRLVQVAVRASRPYVLPRTRVPALIDAHGATVKQAIQIITLTERWHIIDPRIDVFRLAVNAAIHDIHEAFNGYYEIALRTMPMEAMSGPLQGKILPWQLPDDETISALSSAGRKLVDATMQLGNYTHDFQIEMQNALLGELFRTRVPARVPLDSKLKVVELSKCKELTAYFENETAWGREGARIAEDAKRRLQERELAVPPT